MNTEGICFASAGEIGGARHGLAERLGRHAAWVCATAPVVARFYDYAWFAGFGVSFFVYLALMRRRSPATGH